MVKLFKQWDALLTYEKVFLTLNTIFDIITAVILIIYLIIYDGVYWMVAIPGFACMALCEGAVMWRRKRTRSIVSFIGAGILCCVFMIMLFL